MRHGLIIAMALAAGVALGREGAVRALPKTVAKGGMPLMEALGKRSTSRNFTKGATLTDQELSGVLWAANGFNREEKRTSPSAMNAQAVDIYVCDREGVWLYEAKQQALRMVKQGDFRKATGKQDFVEDAAVNLLFVYDLDRAPTPGDDKWAKVDCTFPSQNVYLYCASAGLNTVVRGYFDAQELHRLLGLRPAQRIILTQSVGR